MSHQQQLSKYQQDEAESAILLGLAEMPFKIASQPASLKDQQNRTPYPR